MWDDAEEDDWADEQAWPANDEALDTILCPECGREIYEDADLCPECGYFLETTPNPMSGFPGWMFVLGFLGVLATILALLGLF